MYKKTPVVEISRHTSSSYTDSVLMGPALQATVSLGTDSVHMGTALTATLLRTGWHSPPAGTALWSDAPGWERM